MADNPRNVDITSQLSALRAEAKVPDPAEPLAQLMMSSRSMFDICTKGGPGGYAIIDLRPLGKWGLAFKIFDRTNALDPHMPRLTAKARDLYASQMFLVDVRYNVPAIAEHLQRPELAAEGTYYRADWIAIDRDMELKFPESLRGGLSYLSKPKELRLACLVCGSDNGLKKCQGCNLATYCSVECQRAHWPDHRPVCAQAAQID